MAIEPNPLEFGKYYHIYNRGINSCDIFYEDDNYHHFKHLIIKYLLPVANCFSWVFMKNHFHLLVKIHEENQILRFQKIRELKTLDAEKRLHMQFSNMFNAYAKAFNIRYNRTGSLFENRFKRKEIFDQEYLRDIIVYIHNNPVKHNFCKHPIEYPWSSYDEYLTKNPELQFGPEAKVLFKNHLEYKELHFDSLYNPQKYSDLEF
ncbi:MAG: hypothetical protein K9H49_00620 [Bacteroidales bacterium]|nr:hypothetical protein [Bacteroidales bacterium]MCF8389858.1 hypothetical protein [Bacteroidales bacterium]